MRRLILLAAFLAASAFGQTFTNVSATASYGCAQIFLTSATAGVTTLSWGPTTALGTSFTRTLTAGTPSQHRSICGLTPLTTYYIKLSHASGTDWSCVVAPPVGGLGCDAGTGYGTFTTAALPAAFGGSGELAKPDVSALITAPPAVTSGKTYNVTAGSASSLTTQMGLCAAGVGIGQVGEVVVPYGYTYRLTYSVPKPAGLCILRSSDLTKLPPDGVRISSQFLPFMPVIEAPLENNGHSDETTTSSLYWVNSGNWYLLGINFQTLDTSIENAPEYTFTVNSTGTQFTVSPAPGPEIATFHMIQVKDVAGTWVEPPNGPTSISGVSGNVVTTTFASRGTGTHTGGTGKMRASLAEQVCGASNATPITITTCRDHWFPQKSSIQISSATNNVLTIPANHLIPSGTPYSVLIEGSSVSAYNGIWRTTSSAATTLTLTAPALTGQSCGGTCGTVRWLIPIMISGVGGNTAANGVFYYTSTGARTLDLYTDTGAVAGNGVYTSGGYVAQEPIHFPTMVAVDNLSTNVTIDRCYFTGGFPRRATRATSSNGSNSSIINSDFNDIQFATLWWPGSTTYAILYTPSNGGGGINTRTTVAIDSSHGINKLFQNNRVKAHGISMFTQDSSPPGLPSPSNILIRRNLFQADMTKMLGGATSDGIYYPHRHLLEWKRGDTQIVEGNIFDGGWMDFNPCGPAVMITPVTGTNKATDIWLRYNTFQSISEGFYGVGQEGAHPETLGEMLRRVRLSDNLFRDMDGLRVSRIFNASPSNCGRPFRFELGGESIQIDHNTVEMPAYGGANFKFAEFKSLFWSGVRITNNILYQTGADAQANTIALLTNTWTSNYTTASPDPTAPGSVEKGIFDTVFGPNSYYGNNIVVPGWRNGPATGTTSGYPSGQTRTYNECAVLEPANGSRAVFANFKGFRCLGVVAGGDTADSRRNAAKWIDPTLGGNYRLRHDSPTLASVNRNVAITGNITSGGVISVAAGHAYQVGYAATISGSSTVAHNGIPLTVTAIGTSTITVSGLGGVTCASSCGTLSSPDARVTTDGRDPGADIDALERAQGKVRNTRVLVTGTTTATVAYTAPDTDACSIDYGTSASFATWTRVSDGGGTPYRAKNLTGLATATTYYYRVLCAAEQPSGSFTTR